MNSSDSNLSFKGDNPGAVQYGNFINYYQFHPAENRIKMLPTEIWDTQKDQYVCLDIGCNAGDLTVALYDFLEQNVCPNINILGVDIDKTLIIRAEEKKENKRNILFKCLDITQNMHTINNYLLDNNRQIFDITFCFSTTMWIHLNQGDEGLKKFLKDICECSKMVVIEPQPWKCYRTAVKRFKTTNNEFPLFKKLQIRNNVESFIEEYILEHKFKKIYESPDSEWGRRVLFFKKENDR